MKALLLAAGRGTRISRHIEGKPKCTVPLGNGRTLIQHSVELLRRKGIQDISIALGYQGQVIRDLFKGDSIKFIENPFFDVTNSIASLWFAREELRDANHFIIMNGDVYLSEEAMDCVLQEHRSPVLFYDTSRREEADYKLFCEGDYIVKYGKQLTLDETSGEYVGCATFSAEFLPIFVKRLEELIREQKHGMWWEDVLYSMSAERPVFAKDLSGAFWAEVDYVEDYERIMEFCKGQR